jgi:voltage-gated potassium channel
MSPLLSSILSLLIGLLWVWFIVDYLIRLARAGHARRLFIRTRAFDLISLIVPILRPFLIVVYIWRLPAFRYGNASRQRLRYLLSKNVFAIIFVYTDSWAVWMIERRVPGANIINFEDALWWGFTTITTVGYGDFTPITVWGRILGVALMAVGIVALGGTSAASVSDLTERVRSAAPLKEAEEKKIEDRKG